MSAELTPWFGAREKPVRNGFYEVDRLENTRTGKRRVRRMVEWTGEEFIFTESEGFVRRGGFVCMFAGDEDVWRGLASNPAESAQP